MARASASTGGLRALTRAASGTFLLNVFNTAAAVGTTVVLARVMELASFGVYSWVVATITLLTVPAVLGLDRLLVRDVAVHLGRAAYGHVRGLLRWSAATVVATCTLLVLAAWGVIWATSDVASLRTTALAVGLIALPLLALGRVVQSALMGGGQVVLGQLPELAVRPALFLALVAGALLVTGTPLAAEHAVLLFAASAGGSLIVGVALMRRGLVSCVASAVPAYEARGWAGAAVALTLLSGAAIVNSQTGVVLLGLLERPESAGLYAVAQRGALLIAFPLLAVNAALAPTAARLWAARGVDELQRLVTHSVRATLLASLPVAIVFVAFGGALLDVVFGAPFSGSGDALAILSIGQLANAATGSVATLLIMTGNQWRAAIGILAGMLLNVGLGVMLIPAMGTAGAAVAATVSLIVSNGTHVIIARRRLGIDSTPLGWRPVGNR